MAAHAQDQHRRGNRAADRNKQARRARQGDAQCGRQDEDGNDGQTPDPEFCAGRAYLFRVVKRRTPFLPGSGQDETPGQHEQQEDLGPNVRMCLAAPRI